MALKGDALAAAAGVMARGAADAREGRVTVYSERRLAAEIGVSRHVLRSTVSGLVVDGVVEVERADHRHDPSALYLVNADWLVRTPLKVLIRRDDDDLDEDSNPQPSGQPSSSSATTRNGSVNSRRGASTQPTNQPVPATSQNQGSARSPKPNGDGSLPTTHLTRGVSSVPSAGSAPKVAPPQKSLPLSGPSEATPTKGPSEAKDEEAGSPSGDPSPARVRLSRLPPRAIKAADYLRDRILAQQPGHQLRTRRWNNDDPVRATWADDLRKLVEIDHRSYEEVAKVIGWLFDKQTAEARFVVHSPGALRAKWDRIVAVMSAPARQGPAFAGPRGRRSDAEEEAAALAMAPRAPRSVQGTEACQPGAPSSPPRPEQG